MKELDSDKSSFFRQSGWLMLTTVGGGFLMWTVHFLAKAIPEREYGDFGAFLSVVMVLPAIPIQMVFAQQTAKAIAENRPGEISSLIRAAVSATVLAWIAACIPVVLFQKNILEVWKVSNPAGLWLTVPIVLLSLLLPMFSGVLQGAQNFLWLGWSVILNSLGRILTAAVAVLVLGMYAPGMLLGVLLGLTFAVGVAVYKGREYWLVRPEPFQWRSFGGDLIPLMIAFTAFQVLFTTDTLFVKAYFPQDQAGFYVSAGTLSRALMWLVLPLASVLFPRLVRSAVKSEKTSLLGPVLVGTAVLSTGGAAALALLGHWIIRLVYKASYVDVASSILPWYASVMVPLGVANVLLNQLMARPSERLGLSLWILGLAGVYLLAMWQLHDSLFTVLKVMGVINCLFLLICGVFTWLDRGKRRPA